MSGSTASGGSKAAPPIATGAGGAVSAPCAPAAAVAPGPPAPHPPVVAAVLNPTAAVLSTAQSWFQKGLNHFTATYDYQSAIQSFTKSIFLDPTNHLSYSYRGECYLALADFASAALNYRKAVTLAPAIIALRHRLGYIQYSVGITGLNDHSNGHGSLDLLQDSVVALSEATHLHPENTLFYVCRVKGLIALKEYEQALDILNRFLPPPTSALDFLTAAGSDLFGTGLNGGGHKRRGSHSGPIDSLTAALSADQLGGSTALAAAAGVRSITDHANSAVVVVPTAAATSSGVAAPPPPPSSEPSSQSAPPLLTYLTSVLDTTPVPSAETIRNEPYAGLPIELQPFHLHSANPNLHRTALVTAQLNDPTPRKHLRIHRDVYTLVAQQQPVLATGLPQSISKLENEKRTKARLQRRKEAEQKSRGVLAQRLNSTSYVWQAEQKVRKAARAMKELERERERESKTPSTAADHKTSVPVTGAPPGPVFITAVPDTHAMAATGQSRLLVVSANANTSGSGTVPLLLPPTSPHHHNLSSVATAPVQAHPLTAASTTVSSHNSPKSLHAMNRSRTVSQTTTPRSVVSGAGSSATATTATGSSSVTPRMERTAPLPSLTKSPSAPPPATGSGAAITSLSITAPVPRAASDDTKQSVPLTPNAAPAPQTGLLPPISAAPQPLTPTAPSLSATELLGLTPPKPHPKPPVSPSADLGGFVAKTESLQSRSALRRAAPKGSVLGSSGDVTSEFDRASSALSNAAPEKPPIGGVRRNGRRPSRTKKVGTKKRAPASPTLKQNRNDPTQIPTFTASDALSIVTAPVPLPHAGAIITTGVGISPSPSQASLITVMPASAGAGGGGGGFSANPTSANQLSAIPGSPTFANAMAAQKTAAATAALSVTVPTPTATSDVKSVAATDKPTDALVAVVKLKKEDPLHALPPLSSTPQLSWIELNVQSRLLRASIWLAQGHTEKAQRDIGWASLLIQPKYSASFEAGGAAAATSPLAVANEKSPLHSQVAHYHSSLLNAANSLWTTSLVQSLSGNTQDAIISVARAMELNPTAVELYVARASLYRRRLEFDAARKDLKTALKLCARFGWLSAQSVAVPALPLPAVNSTAITVSVPTTAGGSGGAAIETKTVAPVPSLALTSATPAASQPPTHPVVADVIRQLTLLFDSMGGVYARSGGRQHVLAIGCYDRALELIPQIKSSPAGTSSGDGSTRVSEGSLAIKRGDSFKALGDLPAAVDSYERAARLHAQSTETASPTSVTASNAVSADTVTAAVVYSRLAAIHYEQARIAFNQMNYAAAITQLDVALKYAPECREYHMARSQAREFVGNVGGAYRDLEAAVELGGTASTSTAAAATASTRLHHLQSRFTGSGDRQLMVSHAQDRFAGLQKTLEPSIWGYIKDVHYNTTASANTN